MKSFFLELVEKLTRSSDKVIRNKLYIFLICLGIAVFIWLMIKLSGEYYSNVSYPFRFTNIPAGKLMVENVDSTLSLKLKANGLQLFSIKYFKDHPTVNIDLNRVKLHRCRYKYGSYVLTSSLKSYIINQLEIADKIISVLPDSLFFVMENSEKKMSAVKTDLSISFKKQYYQYGDIVLTPDSVLISGLLSMIDTINFIKTKKIELSGLDKNVDIDIEIVKPLISKNIKYSTDKINVKIPVENYTESSIDLPIIQVGDSIRKIKTFPAKVTITYMVALKDFDRVDKSMFLAGVDCSKINAVNKILNVKLLRQADFVKVTEIFPENVEYIILK